MTDQETVMLELAQLPRRPDRTSVHMIEIDEEYDDHPEIISDIALNALLSTRNIDLRRGDFVCYQHQLGYRNNGKAIYNGVKILNLSFEPDDYGSIPEEFQAVIEFPPLYWSEVIDHNSNIPFTFNKYFQNIGINYIYILYLDDGKSILVFPFKDEAGIYYYIFDANKIDKSLVYEKAEKFISNLTDTRWLLFYRENDNFPLTLDELKFIGVSPEVVLALDDYLIE